MRSHTTSRHTPLAVISNSATPPLALRSPWKPAALLRILLSAILLFGVVGRASAQAPVWEVGSPAPALEGYDGEGKLQKLSDFQGKYVVVDISTAWCAPSFLLTAELAALKARLQSRELDLVIFTVVYQDPLRTPFALRSQALSWEEQFPGTDVVVASHTPTNLLNLLPAARSLLGPLSQAVFPTVAIVDPEGVVKLIDGPNEALSADDYLAAILPDEPSLGQIEMPAVGLVRDRATISVRVGRKTGLQRNPFFDLLTGVLVIPKLQKGTLRHDFQLGISTEAAPGQALWTLHYDTSAGFLDGSDPGIPGDAPITFTIKNVKWQGKRGVLASGTAQVYLYDNILGVPSRRQASVSYRNGAVVVGPILAATSFYPCRYVQVQLYWAEEDARKLAVFGADETMKLSMSDFEREGLVTQWRAIESVVLPTYFEPQMAVRRINALWKDIRHWKRDAIDNAEKRLFLGMLTRMKMAVRQQKLAERRARRAGLCFLNTAQA